MKRVNSILPLTLATLLLSPLALYAKGGRIEGRVVSQTGEGLFGAVITVLKENPNGGTLTFARSDKSGKYRLANISPGVYHLQVSHEGFQPLTRSEIRVEPGRTLNLDIILQGFIDLISAQPDPRNWDVRAVLRSTADRRLIFRDLPGGTVGFNDGGPRFFRSGTVTVASTAGLSAENYSVYPATGQTGIVTNFAFTEPVSDHGRMIFSGQLNSGYDSYWRVRNTYNYRSHPGRDMKFSVGYGRLNLTSPGMSAVSRPAEFFSLDPALRDSGAEIFGFGFEGTTKFVDLVGLEYGFDLSRVYYGTSKDVLSPYFRLVLTPAASWVVRAGMVSRRLSDNNTVMLPDGELLNLMEPTYIAKVNGELTVSEFRHSELSASRAFRDETSVEVAVYQDRMDGPGMPFYLSAESAGNSHPSFAQLREDQTVQHGLRVALNRKFLEFLSGSVAYVYGTGANLTLNDSGSFSSDVLARDLLNYVERSYYHAFSARVHARVPVMRTNLSTVLRWFPGNSLTPIDLFADRSDVMTKGVNFSLRQPLPVPDFMGPAGRWEALVDVRNLFNQGVEFIATSDGRIVLTRNPRSLRFGVNLNFY